MENTATDVQNPASIDLPWNSNSAAFELNTLLKLS